ncbi:hypothetical protein PMAYCL1PPCAC_13166, partial [Pristionchus mayeri]
SPFVSSSRLRLSGERTMLPSPGAWFIWLIVSMPLTAVILTGCLARKKKGKDDSGLDTAIDGFECDFRNRSRPNNGFPESYEQDCKHYVLLKRRQQQEEYKQKVVQQKKQERLDAINTGKLTRAADNEDELKAAEKCEMAPAEIVDNGGRTCTWEAKTG